MNVVDIFSRFMEKVYSKLYRIAVKRNLHDAEISSGCSIRYVEQGMGGLYISVAENFSIGKTSTLKSGTYIDCDGGVEIGEYFHTGRGLTIFSSNHKYYNDLYIPYSTERIRKKVIIEDFVWSGANVTILPGVRLGEGCIIGAGSVVTKDIPPFAVACGNPAKVVKYRDIASYNKLKKAGRFVI